MGHISILFKRILIVGWIILFVWVLLLGLFPRLLAWLPRPGIVGAFVVVFILISFGYGTVFVFRAGMRRRSAK